MMLNSVTQYVRQRQLPSPSGQAILRFVVISRAKSAGVPGSKLRNGANTPQALICEGKAGPAGLSGHLNVDTNILSMDVDYAHFININTDGKKENPMFAAEVCIVSTRPADVYRAAFNPGNRSIFTS
jgi:hypothetical protein